MDVDFYYHMVLATWLCLILNIWLKKHWAALFTILIGLLYEGFDLWFNKESYSGFEHHLTDSIYDLAAAVLAVGVLFIILKLKESYGKVF